MLSNRLKLDAILRCSKGAGQKRRPCCRTFGLKLVKEKLYEMGRVIEGLVYKWNEKNSPVRRAFDAELA
jgi:hypothetical protein